MHIVWNVHSVAASLRKEEKGSEGSDIPIYSERVSWDKRVENHCFR